MHQICTCVQNICTFNYRNVLCHTLPDISCACFKRGGFDSEFAALSSGVFAFATTWAITQRAWTSAVRIWIRYTLPVLYDGPRRAHRRTSYSCSIQSTRASSTATPSALAPYSKPDNGPIRETILNLARQYGDARDYDNALVSTHICIVHNWHALRADMRLAVAKQQPWGADLHTTTCNIVTYVYLNLHLCNNTCTCYIYVMLGSFIYSFTIVTHHDAWDCRPFAEHTPIATSNYSRQLVLRGRKTGAHSRRSYRIANCLLWAPRKVICNFH